MDYRRGDVSSRSVGAEATSHFVHSLEPKGGTRHEVSIKAMVLMVVVVVMVKVMVVRSREPRRRPQRRPRARHKRFLALSPCS